MRKVKLIIYGVLILGSLQSCKYECPGFPDEELRWIPYKVNDTLKYSDSKDTIYLVVNEFYKNGPDSFTGLAMDVDCEEIGHYYTLKSSLYDYQIKDNYSSNLFPPSKIQITEQGDVFELPFYDVYDNPYYTSNNQTVDSIRLRYVADTVIKGVQYKENFIFQKDTIKGNPRISRVIKSSNKGIIEFYDSKFKRKWNLVNK